MKKYPKITDESILIDLIKSEVTKDDEENND